MNYIGIDPGNEGAIVRYSQSGKWQFWQMPVKKTGKITEIDYASLCEILSLSLPAHVFLERALPMAMGAKHAFNYGRGFAAIEIAIHESRHPVTYIEPSKWVKEMHAGIDANLKPKAKSEIAIERLYPELVPLISRSPKSKKLHMGIVEAILICGYGMRKFKGEDE